MSYYGAPPTLIARRGYAGMGDDTGVCRRSDTELYQNGSTITVDKTYAAQFPACSSSSEGTLSKIGGFFSDLFKGAVNFYGSKKTAEGQAAAYQQILQQQQAGQMPSWVLPVGIGAVGLVAIVMLRGAPRQNPARRRRRRRRGSHRRRLYRRRRR
jgi:hypothetical protein